MDIWKSKMADTLSKMVVTFISKWHYITLHIIILFELSWSLFVYFQTRWSHLCYSKSSPVYNYFSFSHFKHITSLKVSSLSWDDSASASTCSKGLANTWTVQDWMTLDWGWMARPTTMTTTFRGHQHTYKALWHLKWPMFKSWLAEHGYEHDVIVE